MARPRLDRFRWPILLLPAILVYGVAGYMLFEGWSFLDSLYMTLLTITTVGYQEVRPLDTSGKIFTITVLILGVAVVLATISLLAGWIAERAVRQDWRRRRMRRRIGSMSDHYILCAYGRVGRTAAQELEAEAISFVVIDAKEDLEEQMIEDGVRYMIGDPSTEDILQAAGVERARGLICAVDSDATNVFITLTARSLNPGIFIVARAADPDSEDQLKLAGADRVISPYTASGRHMAHLALHPRVVDYLDVSAATQDHPYRVEDLQVEDGSELAGRTVGEVCGRAVPLLVWHPDGALTPNPPSGHRLRAGDHLLLLGEKEALRPVEGGREAG
jgi:voltage-gated potassium channel